MFLVSVSLYISGIMEKKNSLPYFYATLWKGKGWALEESFTFWSRTITLVQADTSISCGLMETTLLDVLRFYS